MYLVCSSVGFPGLTEAEIVLDEALKQLCPWWRLRSPLWLRLAAAAGLIATIIICGERAESGSQRVWYNVPVAPPGRSLAPATEWLYANNTSVPNVRVLGGDRCSGKPFSTHFCAIFTKHSTHFSSVVFERNFIILVDIN